MGEEITEILEYQPGELYVKQYKRIKYARPGNAGILIGELPSRPLPRTMAGEGLLAQIVIDKYVDHLPLYRQMQRFERAGVRLPYSTLTEWVSTTCELITPLFNLLAHARRMFNEALDNDYERASHALEEIQKLYTIERISKENNLNFEELKAVRCLKSAPVLKGLSRYRALWLAERGPSKNSRPSHQRVLQ